MRCCPLWTGSSVANVLRVLHYRELRKYVLRAQIFSSSCREEGGLGRGVSPASAEAIFLVCFPQMWEWVRGVFTG